MGLFLLVTTRVSNHFFPYKIKNKVYNKEIFRKKIVNYFSLYVYILFKFILKKSHNK